MKTTTITAPLLSNEAQARACKAHHVATTGETAGERIAAWERLMDMSVTAHLPLPDFLAACGLSLPANPANAAQPAIPTAADLRRIAPATGAQKGMFPFVLHDAEVLAATIVLAAVRSADTIPALLDAAQLVRRLTEEERSLIATAGGVREGADTYVELVTGIVMNRLEEPTN